MMGYQMDQSCSCVLSITVNGIPKAEQWHVFSQFYHSLPDRSSFGKGEKETLPCISLGLSYVKLSVEAHGGTATLSSTESKSTHFTITLPQDQEENQGYACR